MSAPHVLIVEDEPELLYALRVRLSAAGYACETAVNGREALATLERWRPQLIVVDLIMPEMDGYEMVERVQCDERIAAIPVIVLTAVPEHALDRRMASLKVARVLYKPFDTDELITIVRELVTLPPRGGSAHG